MGGYSFPFDLYQDDSEQAYGYGGPDGGSYNAFDNFNFDSPISRPQAPSFPGTLTRSYPDSNFVNQYRGMGGSMGGYDSNYYDPNDPELIRYKELAASKPKSEDILSQYMSSMPTHENTKAGVWRNIGAALMALSAGYTKKDPMAAYDVMTRVTDEPYQRAMSDWRAKGTSVQNEARLADAARARELGTLKFDIEQQAKGERYKSLDQQATDRLLNGLTRDSSRAENQASTLAFRKETEQNNQANRKRALDISQGNLDVRRAEEQRRKNQADNSPNGDQFGELRKQASMEGIKFSHLTSPEELAGNIARKQMISAPEFRGLFVQDNYGRWQIAPNANPERVKAARWFVQQRTNALLGGE